MCKGKIEQSTRRDLENYVTIRVSRVYFRSDRKIHDRGLFIYGKSDEEACAWKRAARPSAAIYKNTCHGSVSIFN